MNVVGYAHFSSQDAARIKRTLARIRKTLALSNADIDVAFISDVEMKELNHTFRGKNKATDVLSFCFVEESWMPAEILRLGDLAISVDTATRQAKACGHSLDVEIAVLVVHGLLHLAGYDHERGADDARDQAELELSILSMLGVDVGAALIGRTFATSRPVPRSR